MKKLGFLLGLVLLFACPSKAQRIIIISGGTVTANVTDSQDFLVNLTTNVTGVTLTQTVTPATGYIISMKFVQDATGSRTVAFGGNITTTCAVNATANAVTICRWQYTASGNTWADAGGSGGGITSVSSLPATCTPGVTAPVNLVIGAVGYGIFRCVFTNTWAPDDPHQVISPLAYGAKWDVKAVTDCTFTNASNTITCPAGEAQFTSADLGKISFGSQAPGALTTSCNGAACGSVPIAQGFICTIVSADSVSVGTTYPGCAANNASATCTPTATNVCAFLWGTQDDSTAINNAAAAAWTGNSCKTLEFPSGMAFFTVPAGGLLKVTLPNGSPCAGGAIADATQTGAQVAGQGASTSVLVPLPTTNFANCTGASSGIACISGPPNWFAHDWGVWGFGQSGSGTTHTNNLVEFDGFSPSCTAAAAWNMSFSEWQTASTGSQGFVLRFGCGVVYASNIVSEGFGNTPCVVAVNSNITTVNALDCFGSSGATAGASLLLVSGGGTINSTGGMYWGVNGANAASGAAAVQTSGGSSFTFNSFSDLIIGATNGNNNFGILFGSGGTPTVNLSGTTVTETNSSGTGNSSLFQCTSTSTACNLNAYSSTLIANGTKMNMFKRPSGVFNFFDACSNSFTQGTIANDTINIFGSCSITGTNVAAGNLVLSAGWGNTPTAAWSALSGTTQQVNGTITAGTAGLAANPTITYTFPTPFIQTPTVCFALQVGGTQAAVANPFTPSALTKTGVTLTYNGTPTASATLQVLIQCWSP